MTDRTLPLPSLRITGFRGISKLELPRLGRVTLLTGRNAVGKTTVLDAVRIFASRGDPTTILNILREREELTLVPRDQTVTTTLNAMALLRQPPGARAQATIASNSSKELTIEPVDPYDPRVAQLLDPLQYFRSAVAVSFGDVTRYFGILEAPDDPTFDSPGPQPFYGPPASHWPDPIRHQSVGPTPLNTPNLAALWDAIALTDSEDLAIRALRIVTGPTLRRVAVIAEPDYSRRHSKRHAVITDTRFNGRIPLQRLGEGATRLFGLALAIANCRDGILLVDEAENGIHHTVHADLWKLLFSAAADANVQVIATTHSWDCVTGFAAAALESDAEGVLYRLESCASALDAVEYSETNLKVAAEQRIEVR